jgi:Fibronectin type III domain
MRETVPRSRRSLWYGPLVLLCAAVMTVPLLPTVGPTPFGPGPSLVPAEPGGSAEARVATVGSAAVPQVAAYPVANRVFTVNATAPPGLLYPGSFSAYDALTHDLYATDASGDLTVFGADNATAVTGGALFTDAQPTLRVTGMALDAAGGRLFVTVANSTASWIWVLDAASLHLLHNLSSFAPPFVPWTLEFESNSSRLVVLNASDAGSGIFGAAVIDPTSYAILHLWTLPCPSVCRVGSGDVEDIPSQDLLAVSTETPTVYLLNPSNFTSRSLFIASNWVSGPSAFDSTDSFWILGNDSSPYAGYVPVLMSSFYPPMGVSGARPSLPSSLSTALWEPTSDTFLLGGTNGSLAGSPEEFTVLAGSTTVVAGSWVAPAADGFGRPLATLLEPGTSPHVLVISAGGQNGSRQLAVSAATPYVTVVQTYPDLATGTTGVVVDSVHGIAIQHVSPLQAIRAYSVTTGAVLWTHDLGPTQCISDLAVDSRLGRVYVPLCTSSVEVYDTTSGALLGALSPPGGIGSTNAYVDAVRDWLFVTGWISRNVTVYHLNGSVGTYSGTIVPPPGPISFGGLAPDPAADRLWYVVSYSSSGGTAELFNETSLAWIANLSTPGENMFNVLSDQAGRLYFENTNTYSIGVYNELAGAWGSNLTLRGTPGMGPYAVAPADGWLFVNLNRSQTAVLDLATAGPPAVVPLPLRWLWSSWPNAAAWDPVSHTFVAQLFGGSLALVHEVPLPTVPLGLAAASGNRSATLSWSASTGAPGFPILDYTVELSSASSGPWTVVAHASSPTAVVAGLTNGQGYFFRVQATSAAGVSALTAAVSATPAAVPFPPTGLGLSASGTDSLQVNWSAPADIGGSAITGYSVQYALMAAGPWNTVATGTTTSATITGLGADTTYYVRVAAVNAIGTGNPSSVAFAKTHAAAPGGLGAALASPLLWVVLAVVAIAAIAVAVLFLRRRPAAPTGAQPWGGPSPPSAPPPGAVGPPPASPGGPPAPPAEGPPVGPPPTAPPP